MLVGASDVVNIIGMLFNQHMVFGFPGASCSMLVIIASIDIIHFYFSSFLLSNFLPAGRSVVYNITIINTNNTVYRLHCII